MVLAPNPFLFDLPKLGSLACASICLRFIYLFSVSTNWMVDRPWKVLGGSLAPLEFEDAPLECWELGLLLFSPY
jgi:hypothetical protein